MGSACTLLAATEGYDLALADLSADKLQELAANCSGQSVSTAPFVLVKTTRAPEAAEYIEIVLMEFGVDWDRIESLKQKYAIA